MPVHWPTFPRSSAEVPHGTSATPPGKHRTFAGAYAGLNGD